MTSYLLDTNVVMRFCNPSDVQHPLATNAIASLLVRSDECLLAAQVIITYVNNKEKITWFPKASNELSST